MNKKSTSKNVAKLASKTLHNENASAIQKQLAGSALSQFHTGNQTGSHMEDVASKVLNSNKYNQMTKKLAGSVLSQSNKER